MEYIVTIISLKKFKSSSQELLEWQTRLRLAYELEWDDRAKSMCHAEVKRLTELTKPATIRDKIDAEGKSK